jgi:hypothetical protein
MTATTLVEPLEAEEYAPVTVQDMIEHGVDQKTPLGVFTRLASAVAFSHSPSALRIPTGLPGAHFDTITWSTADEDGGSLKLPHEPSRLARDGGIRSLISCYGIEDRGDGGGGFSLASRELFEYFKAKRAA